MPDLITTFNFALEIDDVNDGLLQEVSGIESETEIIEYKEATKEGRMIIRKVPGDEVGRHHARAADRQAPRRCGSGASRSSTATSTRPAVTARSSPTTRRATEVARWNFDERLAIEVEGRRFRREQQRGRHRETVTITHEGLVRA